VGGMATPPKFFNFQIHFLMKKLFLFLIFSVSLTQIATAKFRIAKIFSNHMVLQRDAKIPVWGWAEGKEKIKVTFDGKTYKAKVDKDGKWVAYLPKMKAGGPYEMRIKGKKTEIVLSDILVGDVWLCSGQSNMEWPVSASNNAQKEIANASDTQIRHFKVPRTNSPKPEDELKGGEWQSTSPETVGAFTAVGYFFARHLREHQNVPIGLLNSSWGGSRIEPWMPAHTLGYKNQKEATKEFANYEKNQIEKRKAELKEKMKVVPEKDKGLVNGEALWAKNTYKDNNWREMELPGLWEGKGYEGLDGIVWYRKTIRLTAEQAQEGATLSLGKIDDSDITWVNGQKVGEMTGAYNVLREYEVPSSYLKPGQNTITIRVEDTGGGGGINGAPSELSLLSGGQTIPLSGNWKYKVAEVRFNSTFSANQIPTLLYNQMIHPIIDFPIKGALWYQGESNASENDAFKYRDLFATMIKEWRSLWDVGEFPFLWVQLANFMAVDEQPNESSWAVLRESQTATLELPNTAEAVIIDLGEADDIHPRNKQDVGYRLALGARKIAYGEKIVHSSPTFESMKVKGNEARLKFELNGSKLITKDKYGYVKGFAIAGSDGKFVWAKGRIEGNEVILSSEQVKKPKAVRYAWGNNPDEANLYNSEGLPVTPFRTDQ